MQHFKNPQLRRGWFFYGPYCIKSLESSLLQSTLSVKRWLLLSLSIVETNSSFVSTLKQQHHWRCPSFIKKFQYICALIWFFPSQDWKEILHPHPSVKCQEFNKIILFEMKTFKCCFLARKEANKLVCIKNATCHLRKILFIKIVDYKWIYSWLIVNVFWKNYPKKQQVIPNVEHNVKTTTKMS